jgi:Domain of unknown function (DUF3291)
MELDGGIMNMANLPNVGFRLAQFNFARARFPTDDIRMKAFVDALDEINELSERSSGFVWRLQTGAGHSIDIRPFEDDNLKLITLSAWRDIESLRQFVYRSAHAGFLRRRDAWFKVPREPYLVLWWVSASDLPTVADGMERLNHLKQFGATLYAFDFRTAFNADGTPYVTLAQQTEQMSII